MPTLLQRLAGVGGGAVAAAAAAGGHEAGDVEEVLDLTADDEGEAGGGDHAAAAAAGESEADLMQAFLAGQIDVLLVSEQQRGQGSSWAAAPAHAVRVKDDPEG
jgi:hypothetical protein